MNRCLSVTLVGFTTVLCACPGEGTGPGGNAAYCDTVTAVSFTCDVQPIFSANCALSGCHVSPNPPEGMNLSAGQAYADIVNVPSGEIPRLFRVEPGNPDSSYLVMKIENAPGIVLLQMPAGGAPLSPSQIDTIRAWVAAGAPDN